MQSSNATPAQRFLWEFWRLNRAVFHRVNPTMKKEHDLELPELLLLRKIAHSGLSPSELAEQLRLPPPVISRKLESLEAAGLISRALDKQDARRRVLSISEEGLEMLPRATATLEREVTEILSALGEVDLESFLSHLETISRQAQESQ